MTPAEDTPRTAPSDEVATPAALAEENARLRTENAALQETIAVLLARVAELERRLGGESAEAPEDGVPVTLGIGDVVLRQQLGAGGMGKVYRALRRE